MVLPATPEEAQELLRHRYRWLRWGGAALAAVLVVALGAVLLRSGDDPTAEAGATEPSAAPATAAAEGAAPSTAAPLAEQASPPPPQAAEAVTVRGEGSDSVDLAGSFVDGHVVLRYAIAGEGAVVVTDGSGTVLDGGSIVIDGTTAASGAVIVPRLATAALASIEADGAWELTALSAENLPVLQAGATIESSGNAALRLGDAAGVEVAVVGDCVDDAVLVELWDDAALLSSVELTGSGSVPMLRDTRYVSVRSSCTWSISV